MKNKPQKIFIFNDDKSRKEISFEEFCQILNKCKENNTKRWFVASGRMLMEVSEEKHKEFSKIMRSYKYGNERSAKNKDISYDRISKEAYNGEEFIQSPTPDIHEQIEHKIDLQNMNECLALLSRDEQLLLHRRYYLELSQDELSKIYGISQQAVSKRIKKTILKLRKLMKI